jgi:hypothetical protein
LIRENPPLANQGIQNPFDNRSTRKAHPLHRIADAIFSAQLTEEEGIRVAKIFLDNGASINGEEQKDTPLIAAASLHADKLGIFYTERGADIRRADHQDGATALHWAAYCGRDKLVEKLVACGAALDQPDNWHAATAIGWAVQPLQRNDRSNIYNQVSCIKILLVAGASMAILKRIR